MYTPGTILELKQQREPDEETGEDFPYNRVTVIGASPVDHGGARGGDWSGSEAVGVILQPITNFGANLDEPLGKVQALYDVVEVPETVIEQPKIRVINATTAEAGDTPEQVFAREAPGEPDPEGGRKRTPLVVDSPLEDPRKPPSASPLDE